VPSSSDPAKRARQLENLANLRGEPTAGSFQPGASPALKHGQRSRQPQRSPEWSPAVELAIRDLEDRVGAELRDGDGELQAWALPSVEAVALLRVQAWRMDRFVADREARGVLKREDLDLASKGAERYHRGLEREALTLRSRLEAHDQAFDLAREMAEHDATEREARDA
jgi:hypothetical protein